MSKEPALRVKRLREVFFVLIVIGRWSFFIGFGEVLLKRRR